MINKSDSLRRRSHVFLREWRKHRGLTQVHVAQRIGTTQATIARVETGKLPYNEDLLQSLAAVYKCQPADLLAVNPLAPDLPKALYDRVRSAPRPLQERIAAVIEALLNAS